MPQRLDALLVCGGRYHDMDYVRLQLLQQLSLDEAVRTTVVPDYSNIADHLDRTDFLVTYTCDVVPTDAQSRALADWVADGHRWLALHGTNSAMRVEPDLVTAQELPEDFVDVVGSRFLAHPPVGPIQVVNARPDHDLVKGIATFTVTDELYLSELRPGIQPLLTTSYSGLTPRFADHTWTDDEPRVIAYLNPHGAGCVYYITLGHARGHYDMAPLMEYWPTVDRGPWDSPEYREIIARGLRWAAEQGDPA